VNSFPFPFQNLEDCFLRTNQKPPLNSVVTYLLKLLVHFNIWSYRRWPLKNRQNRSAGTDPHSAPDTSNTSNLLTWMLGFDFVSCSITRVNTILLWSFVIFHIQPLWVTVTTSWSLRALVAHLHTGGSRVRSGCGC